MLGKARSRQQGEQLGARRRRKKREEEKKKRRKKWEEKKRRRKRRSLGSEEEVLSSNKNAAAALIQTFYLNLNTVSFQATEVLLLLLNAGGFHRHVCSCSPTQSEPEGLAAVRRRSSSSRTSALF